MILYIYGPRGCGKTSNSLRFGAHYKMPVFEEAEFFNGQTRQLNNVIILGDDAPMDDATSLAMNIKNISFEEAMKASAT